MVSLIFLEGFERGSLRRLGSTIAQFQFSAFPGYPHNYASFNISTEYSRVMVSSLKGVLKSLSSSAQAFKQCN